MRIRPQRPRRRVRTSPNTQTSLFAPVAFITASNNNTPHPAVGACGTIPRAQQPCNGGCPAGTCPQCVPCPCGASIRLNTSAMRMASTCTFAPSISTWHMEFSKTASAVWARPPRASNATAAICFGIPFRRRTLLRLLFRRPRGLHPIRHRHRQPHRCTSRRGRHHGLAGAFSEYTHGRIDIRFPRGPLRHPLQAGRRRVQRVAVGLGCRGTQFRHRQRVTPISTRASRSLASSPAPPVKS